MTNAFGDEIHDAALIVVVLIVVVLIAVCSRFGGRLTDGAANCGISPAEPGL